MREVSRYGLRLPLIVVTLLTGSAAWRPVLAGPPTGYRCGPGGHPDSDAGACVCAAPRVSKRDGDGTARCVLAARPKPRHARPEPLAVAEPSDDCATDGRGCAAPERAAAISAAAIVAEPGGDSCRDDVAEGEVCDRANADVRAEDPDALVVADLEDAPEHPIVGFQVVEPGRDTPHRRLSSRRKASLALGAVGGICLGGALMLDVSAHQIYDRSAVVYGTQEEAAAYQRANRRHLGAQAALGAGLAFGLAAGYLWFTGGRTSSSTPVVSIDGRSVHVALEGEF